jgi:hypothetical protein
VGVDVAVVRFDECLGDGQADAGAPVLAVSGSVDSVEAIEQAGQVFWRYAITGVGYGDNNGVLTGQH